MKNSGFEDSRGFGEESLDVELIPLEIGPTTTCRVYKTRILGKWLFVKELKLELRQDSRLEAAFLKEMEIGYQLEHPGLPRYVLTKGVLPEGRYVAMEYIDGETLEEFVKNNPHFFNDPDNLRRFVSELADVLDYLHSRQIMHLDIKPSNVMITRIGHNAKLIDLGFCQSDTFRDTSGHTPEYLAPEREKGTEKTPATDYYGLGLLLKFIRTHISPYPGKRFNRLEEALLKPEPEERPASREQVEKLLVGRKFPISIILIGVAIILVAGLIVFRPTGETPESEEAIDRVTPDTVVARIPEEDTAVPVSVASAPTDEKKSEEIPAAVSEIPVETSVPVKEPVAKETVSHKESDNRKTEVEADQIEKLKQEVRTSVDKAYGPACERLHKAIRENNYSEEEHAAIQEMLLKSLSVVALSKEYEMKYPAIPTDRVRDIVVFEMEEREYRLWRSDWQKYDFEYLRRKRAAGNNGK